MRYLVLAAALAVAAGPLLACTVAPSTQMPETERNDPRYDVWAWFEGPTTAYGHGVLGDTIEATRVRLFTPLVDGAACRSVTADAGEGHVFEDVAPRLQDLDGDGRAEVIVVRSSFTKGAQLAIYAEDGDKLTLIASTPYIGRRNRWLAPIGAADLDGDRAIEIAYIDRPHLAKVLRVWRYKDGQLSEVAAGSGLTNHRIGERDIAGGIRDCGQGPELITANADWTQIIATQFMDGKLTAQAIGPHEGRASFAAALSC